MQPFNRMALEYFSRSLLPLNDDDAANITYLQSLYQCGCEECQGEFSFTREEDAEVLEQCKNERQLKHA